jgi:hypothetical protein
VTGNGGFLISLTKAFDHFDQMIKVLPYLNLGKNTLFCLPIP